MNSSIEIGSLIKKYRENKNISIFEVSRIVNIRKHYLENIEEGNWSEIPGNTYLKGYLKIYSKFLNISDFDLKKIDEYFTDKKPMTIKEKLQEIYKVEKRDEGIWEDEKIDYSQNKNLVKKIYLFLFFILICLIAFCFYYEYANNEFATLLFDDEI